MEIRAFKQGDVLISLNTKAVIKIDNIENFTLGDEFIYKCQSLHEGKPLGIESLWTTTGLNSNKFILLSTYLSPLWKCLNNPSK